MIGFAATIYTIAVPGGLTLLVPWLILRFTGGGSFAVHGYHHLGWPLIAGGALMIAHCAWNFVVHGHGTPAPTAAPTTLVARGLYRWTRNPMYVGVLTMLLGEALVFASTNLLWNAVGTWTGMHLFVLFYEERGLVRRFGASYLDYCARVPRWLGWPRDAA